MGETDEKVNLDLLVSENYVAKIVAPGWHFMKKRTISSCAKNSGSYAENSGTFCEIAIISSLILQSLITTSPRLMM